MVPSIPGSATTIQEHGETYLYANDVYYRPRPDLGGYEVVNDPAEAAATTQDTAPSALTAPASASAAAAPAVAVATALPTCCGNLRERRSTHGHRSACGRSSRDTERRPSRRCVHIDSRHTAADQSNRVPAKRAVRGTASARSLRVLPIWRGAKRIRSGAFGCNQRGAAIHL
jgi:hypothetical protein